MYLCLQEDRVDNLLIILKLKRGGGGGYMNGKKKLKENVVVVKTARNHRYTFIAWSDGSEISTLFVAGGDYMPRNLDFLQSLMFDCTI